MYKCWEEGVLRENIERFSRKKKLKREIERERERWDVRVQGRGVGTYR